MVNPLYVSGLFRNFAPALQKAEERQKAEEQNPLLGLVRGTNDVMQQYDEADKARNTPVPEAKQRTITPLEVLIGVVGGAIDPKAGQAFFAGLQHGISQENQRREASRKEALAKQEQMARTLEGRAARADVRNQMIYKERVDTNEKREAAKQKITLAQYNLLMDLPEDARPAMAGYMGITDPTFIKNISKRTAKAEKDIAQGKLYEDQGYKIRMETPERIAQMRGAANASNASADLSREKIATERAMRPSRLLKMEADIKGVLAATKLKDVQAQKVLQYVANYDDEFKLKVAKANLA